MSSPQANRPKVNPMGAINWIGLGGLCWKEVKRFLSVYIQTVVAPIITTLLFLIVFSVALGRAMKVVSGVPFMEFLAPGLIMMAIIQNAFSNTSSSLVSAKMQGNIVDMIMAPLSPMELTAGYAFGGMARGLLVGLVVGLAMLPFVSLQMANPGHVLFYAVAASLMLSLLGIIGGIWADKHEQVAAFTNFVITPLAFLSGTFYSIDRLPGAWNTAAHLNPFFYLIDGLRYGFIGQAESSLEIGYAISVGGNVVLGAVCWALFKTGYRLRP